MIKDKTLITYAQNREDLILLGFFDEHDGPGFYVDVGANHPKEDSVTKLFYDLGWQGVNIEPSPSLYKLLKKARPRDINLNIGIADKSGEFTFREYAVHGLSTFSKEMMERYRQHKESSDPGSYREYKIKTKTLKEVFAENNATKINFLKVDVEGSEYEVLAGNDWDKYRPQVICIESNHILRDWRPLLKKHRYEKIFYDGLNDYYVDDDHPDIKKRFSYPDTVLLRPRVLEKKTLHQAEKLQEQANNYRRQLSHLQLTIAELRAKNFQLMVELYKTQSFKGHLRELYRIFDNKIMSTIDRKGYAISLRRKGVSPPVFLPSQSRAQLMRVAYQYDVSSYFNYSSMYKKMKLRWRVAAKAYRVSRDASVPVLRKGYARLRGSA